MTKQEFTQITSNYDSHRPLLWEALESTKGLVVEMGCGYGSTPFLTAYTKQHGRELISGENNYEWYEKMIKEYPHIKFFQDWNTLHYQCPSPDLVFIDHAPGERRKIDIKHFADRAKIIVAHDTEPAADQGYKMRSELKKFKWMIDYETNGAWATAVSNFVDVTKFNL